LHTFLPYTHIFSSTESKIMMALSHSFLFFGISIVIISMIALFRKRNKYNDESFFLLSLLGAFLIIGSSFMGGVAFNSLEDNIAKNISDRVEETEDINVVEVSSNDQIFRDSEVFVGMENGVVYQITLEYTNSDLQIDKKQINDNDVLLKKYKNSEVIIEK